jgi:predicted ATPase
MRYRELPPISITGRGAPRRIWQACAPVSRPVGRPVERDATPLIARTTELATATERVVRAVRHREPQWVSIVGPAGIGKSRLVTELIRSVDAAGGRGVTWRIGRCAPPAGPGWHPLAEIAHGYAQLGGCDDRAVPRAPLVRSLLAVAEHGPLVIVVEDLDRADPGLIRFLHAILAAASAAALPMAVVTTQATQALSAVDTPPVGTPAADTITLRPLSLADTDELLTHLLRRAGLSQDLVARLGPLVAGIPGYAHEYVRMVADGRHLAGGPEADGADLPVPEPLRRLVTARLDRLERADRVAVQAAAILDAGINADALAALLRVGPAHAHALLRHLVALGVLIRQAGRAPGGQPEFVFAEPAVRQVAYAQLPRAVRAEHHRRAAQWLASVTLVDGSQPLGDRALGDRARHEVAAFDLARAVEPVGPAVRASAEPALTGAAR